MVVVGVEGYWLVTCGIIYQLHRQRKVDFHCSGGGRAGGRREGERKGGREREREDSYLSNDGGLGMRLLLRVLYPHTQATPSKNKWPGIHCSCMCAKIRNRVSKCIRERPRSSTETVYGTVSESIKKQTFCN